jgi:hypothetical protein
MVFPIRRRCVCGWLIRLTAAVSVLSVPALGGAWNDAPAHGELIMTASMLKSWDEYGANGARSPFGYGGRFQQVQFGNYLELGLPKKLTLVLNLPISSLEYSDQYNRQQCGTLGDLEIGLRRRLNRIASPWAISGQLTVSAPAYSANEHPAPGNHQEDLEGRLLVGRGSELGERHWFWDAEAAYRYRTGAPADQLRGDFTAGVDVFRRLMVMGQFFSIKGLRNGQPVADIQNPNAQSDFDLYKAQGSLVIGITHKTRLQTGWGKTLAGRNVGRGETYVLGFWQSF